MSERRGQIERRLAASGGGYGRGSLREEDLAPTWLGQLERWLEDAYAAGIAEPNAMVLATAGADLRPSARTVLLKGTDDRGLVFFTNLRSRKGRELAENPRAALLFSWLQLERQVVIEATVEQLSAAESDAYFATRPRGAQLAALASPQSEAIGSRAELEGLVAKAAERHPEGEPIPRPPHWGGLRALPDRVELWQGGSDRLHDRLRYRRRESGWIVERLAP